jgi:hypothetical protein
MKRCLLLAGMSLVFGSMMTAAEGNFSRGLRAKDFAGAGLDKLSSEELARLDALVHEFKSGAVSEAEKRAAQAEAEAHVAKAQAAEQTKTEASRLAQIRERLTPRAAMAIEPVESRIAGKFIGWKRNTVFVLENGEHWKVANAGTSYYTSPVLNPKVKIEPASFGGYWMTIDGVDQRVRVVPLGTR